MGDLAEIYGMRKEFLTVALVAGLWCCCSPTLWAQYVPCQHVSWSELQGDLDPASHAGFAVIPPHLTHKSNIYLRKEALEALEAMARAAAADGVELNVVSAMRTWSHQKRIWDGKWDSPRFMGFVGAERAEEILRYSSMPGSSRHHWGTDVDLNALENSYFETGTGLALYTWLVEHAAEFGFVQVYGDMSNGRTGYQEEKWHWSYWPLASGFLDCYLALRPADGFSGFEGSHYSDSLRIIDRYVQGIDGPQ